MSNSGASKFLLLVLSSLSLYACTTPAAKMRVPQGCQHWDINGTWSMDQANGFYITVIVRQTNDEFAGTADYGSGPVPLVGTVRDNHLAMTVSWPSGGAGLYTAAMSPSGLLTDGFTQNISMPGSTATWSTARQFQCVAKLPR
jgi:hypothetical protein